MDTPPITVHVIVNQVYNASALLDSGCLCYAIVSRKFAVQSHLERFSIPPQMIEGINGKLLEIREVA
jgi:hypothetical protein